MFTACHLHQARSTQFFPAATLWQNPLRNAAHGGKAKCSVILCALLAPFTLSRVTGGINVDNVTFQDFTLRVTVLLRATCLTQSVRSTDFLLMVLVLITDVFSLSPKPTAGPYNSSKTSFNMNTRLALDAHPNSGTSQPKGEIITELKDVGECNLLFGQLTIQHVIPH